MNATISGQSMNVDPYASISIWKGVDGQIRPFAIEINTTQALGGPDSSRLVFNITADQAHELLTELLRHLSDDAREYLRVEAEEAQGELVEVKT